jgi:hypothetical protein
LRITAGRSVPKELTEAAGTPLLRATGLADAAALRRRMERTAKAVRGAFVRIIGEVA